MTAERQNQARDVLAELHALRSDERDAALSKACGADSALRLEVEALLRTEAAGGASSPAAADVDDASLSMNFNTAEAPSANEAEGVQIGPYRLLKLVGEGGFGSVWMAEQKEPFRRRVAIKLIKTGMDTKQVLARFDAERQALALMDHPNIAKVLDAGTTAAGRPYFVMEYIAGVPILKYCDQEKLDTPARLGLFVRVCQAVQHAHQKGVIHRDLKPSNVLVAMQDGRPVPKVIDFGIAKATSGALTDRTLVTEQHQMVGTPAYMSPEQADGSALDVDTRSDIYSLGVVLYELLTGSTPFDVYDLMKKGVAEMLRILREEEPQKPSTRVTTREEGSADAARSRRSATPAQLSQLLKGDLDWIVMKCLEKDRTRRYETANGLALDIERHLANEPVTARPPTAGYQLSKFVRRHRTQVIAASAVVAALVAGVVAFAWQAEAARDERDDAVAARASEAAQRRQADEARAEAQSQATKAREQEAEAKKQAAVAEAVAKFLTDMLAAVDPNQLPKDPTTDEPLKDRVTVLQAIKAAIKKLEDGAFAGQPLVEARVRDTIGRTLRELGRYDEAEPLLREALKLRRAARPHGHRDIVESLNGLATCLSYQTRFADAEQFYREALDLCRAHRAANPPGDPQILSCLNNFAALMVSRLKYDEAERALQELQEIEREAPSNWRCDSGATKSVLGVFLMDRRRFEEAEPLVREALEEFRATHPVGHPMIANALCNLGTLLHHRKQLAEAERLLRDGLKDFDEALPTEHPIVALMRQNLAGVLKDLGKVAEAETLYRQALAVWRANPAIERRAFGVCIGNFADLLKNQGNFTEAEPLYREALAFKRALRPVVHEDICNALSNLGGFLVAQGRLTEAEPYILESLEIRRATLPAGHTSIAAALTSLATLRDYQRRLAEAASLYRESLDMLRAALPDGHPDFTANLNNLGVLLEGQGDFEAAEPLLRESLRITLATTPTGSLDVARCHCNLAGLLHSMEEPEEAEVHYLDALKIFRAAPSAHSMGLSITLANYATMLMTQGRLADAEPVYLEALTISRASLPALDPTVGLLAASLGRLYWSQARFDRSIPMLEEALKALTATMGRAHASTLETLSYLGLSYRDAGRFADAVPPLEEAYGPLKADARSGWVGDALLDAYANVADPAKPESVAKVATLLKERLAHARTTLPDGSPELAARLIGFGSSLLAAQAWAEAEPLLREALAIREARTPSDWRTFNAKSRLGGALLGQKKLADAEPLLLGGYRGMKERAAELTPMETKYLREALERLVQLSEAKGDAREAAAWRTELEAARAASRPSKPEGQK